MGFLSYDALGDEGCEPKCDGCDALGDERCELTCDRYAGAGARHLGIVESGVGCYNSMRNRAGAAVLEGADGPGDGDAPIAAG